MAVIPYIQPGLVVKDEPRCRAQPLRFAHGIPVDERTGTLLRKDDLHEGSEALRGFYKARVR